MGSSTIPTFYVMLCFQFMIFFFFIAIIDITKIKVMYVFNKILPAESLLFFGYSKSSFFCEKQDNVFYK